MRRLLYSAVPVVLIVAACSSDDGPKTISKTIGPEGGTIDVTLEDDSVLGGTQLVIPPNALAKATTITISRGTEIAQNGEQARGPSVRLSPDGTQLAVAATLRVPQNVVLPNDPGTLVIAVMSGGTHSEIAVTGADGKGSHGNIQHFSDYELVSTTESPDCEAAVKAHTTSPGAGDEKNVFFCYKNYVCRVCKDDSCGDDIGTLNGNGCGGGFAHNADCLTSDWNPPGVAPPVMPGCIKEAPADLSMGDQQQCCATADPPAPTAPPFEPKDACMPVCGAQGASSFGLQWDCATTDTTPGVPGCSGTGNVRWYGKDTTTCDWYVSGVAVARDLEDVAGAKHSITISGYPVGTQPPLPGSLGQGQECPNKDPAIGVSVKIADELIIPAELKCTDSGTTTTVPFNIDLTDAQAWLCTQCQTHTKDYFKSELGGGIYSEYPVDPAAETKAGGPFPPVKCVLKGGFNLAGCNGGVCKQ